MPTYEYSCEDCSHQFEELQKISDAPITKCPKCSGKVERLFQTAGVIVKGAASVCSDSSCRFREPTCGMDRPCGARPCD